MSDKDIPSGPENERTIIKPNPGLRRPAAPAKPARPPQPEQTPSPAPYTPVTAPAYQPHGSAAATGGGTLRAAWSAARTFRIIRAWRSASSRIGRLDYERQAGSRSGGTVAARRGSPFR